MSETVFSSNSRGSSLYQAIKLQLIEDIESGAVAPGDVLPNERDLASRFEVAIGTLRRAVDELVAEGILVRQQGRGTFVRRQDREQFMYQFFKITARDGVKEFPKVQTHSFAKARASQEEAKALGLQTGQAVIRICNVLSLAEQSVIIDQIVIAQTLFEGLTRKMFESRPSTIYEHYQSVFGVTVVGGTERARAIACDEFSAQMLGLEVGQPVLRLERIAHTFGGKPAEYRTSIVNTDHFDYVSNLQSSSA